MALNAPKYGAVASTQEHGDIKLPEGPTLPKPLQNALLALVLVITVGSHYEKQSLASLGPEIMARLDIQRALFGFLFSSQQLPGIFLPVVSGVALTLFPHGPAAIVLSSSIFVSTAICAIAVNRGSYTALLIGRFLFGLFDGALCMLQGALVFKWFKGRVSATFGLTILICRVSSFLGLSLPAFLSHIFSLQASMWFSAALCIPSFIATVFFAVFCARNGFQQFSTAPSSLDPTEDTEQNQDNSQSSVNSSAFSGVKFLNLLRSFPFSFWVLCYIWVAAAGAVSAMLHFAPDAFSSQFGLSESQSGLISGTLLLISGICSPAFGALQDQKGRRAAILITSCCLISSGILLWAYALGTGQNPAESNKVAAIVGLVFIGTGFAATPVTMLSCIALTVDNSIAPAALGLHSATENTGLAIIHVTVGFLRDILGSYVQAFLFVAGLSLSGALAAFFLGWKVPAISYGADQVNSGDK